VWKKCPLNPPQTGENSSVFPPTPLVKLPTDAKKTPLFVLQRKRRKKRGKNARWLRAHAPWFYNKIQTPRMSKEVPQKSCKRGVKPAKKLGEKTPGEKISRGPPLIEETSRGSQTSTREKDLKAPKKKTSLCVKNPNWGKPPPKGGNLGKKPLPRNGLTKC